MNTFPLENKEIYNYGTYLISAKNKIIKESNNQVN